MATPPAAYVRWKSTRSVVTRERWLRPSYVAALITRLRSVNGPSCAGESTSGIPATCSLSAGYRRADASERDRSSQPPDLRVICRHRPGDAGSMQLEGLHLTSPQ